MKCPSCGADNPDDNRFCHRCGKEIPENPEPNVIGHRCPKCGTENRVGLSYCSKCGANLENAEPIVKEPDEEKTEETHEEKPKDNPKASPKPKPKNPKAGRNATIAAVVALIVILAGAVIALEYMNHCEVEVTSSGGGTVSGGGTYEKGDRITIFANPSDGMQFDGWYVDGKLVSMSKSYSFIVEEDITLKGHFSTIKYNVTTKTNMAGGSVSGAAEYERGKTVTVNATVNYGYVFDGWYRNGTRVSEEPSYSFRITDNVTLEARYHLQTFDIKLSSSYSETSVSGGGTYEYLSKVTIRTTSQPGFDFKGWYNGSRLVGNTQTYTLEVTGNMELVAKYGIIHDSSFTIYNVKTSATNTNVMVTPTYDVAISKRTVTVTDMLGQTTYTSERGAGQFGFSYSEPKVLRIELKTTYIDGVTNSRTEYALVNGEYSVDYNWHYQVTTWYSDLTPWLNNREANWTLTGDLRPYYDALTSGVIRGYVTDSSVIAKYITYNEPDIRDMADAFLSLTSGCKDVEKVGCVLKFVQSIPYQYDTDGRGAREWWKLPMETLVEKRGDCEDHAFLLAAILEAMGFDTVIFQVECYDSSGNYTGAHMATGVNVSGASGTYYTVNGKNYYYCEGTAEVGAEILKSYDVGTKPNGYKVVDTYTY